MRKIRGINIWFSGINLNKKQSGDNGTVDTPVPIPNTEVKHSRGEGSWLRPARITRCQAFFIIFFWLCSLNRFLNFYVMIDNIIWKHEDLRNKIQY